MLPKINQGFRLGKLTVVSDTGKRKSGYTVWNCACDCGGSICLDTRSLQRGKVQDCGCVTKVKPGQLDLTGQRFGRLVAMEPTQQRAENGSAVWRCKCDCGREALAAATQLSGGYKKSCGCLSNPPLKDYVGKQFGKLTVTEYAGKEAGMHRWQCKCDCGNTTVVGQTLLQSGKTRSCGCIQNAVIYDNMRFVEGTSVTLLESAKKRHVRSNTSGYNGVYLNRKTQKWVAQIGFKRKTYYLGSFRKLEDAVEARKKAEERIYGEFLEWYYETHPSRKS